MKKSLTVLMLLILFFSFSCKEDKQVPIDASKSGFDIGNVHYVSDKTTAYQTDFGQLLKINGANFELYIFLSDRDNKIFSITDTLTAQDNGKARCIFKMNGEIKFSTSGTIEFDSDKKSGTFTIDADELAFKNGQIKVDTTINHAIIDFTSLTMRDIQGTPMNTGDINDWNIRTSWDIAERLVFNLKSINTLPGNIELIEYPNPFTVSLTMNLGIPAESKIDLYLVNANFEIELKVKGLQAGNVSLLLDKPEYKGNYYRMFYRIYSGSEQFFGTGDIKAQE